MPRRSRARTNGTHPTIADNSVTSTTEIRAVDSTKSTTEASPVTSTTETPAAEPVQDASTGDVNIADNPASSTSEMPAAGTVSEASAAPGAPKRTPKRTSQRTSKRAPKPAVENGAESAAPEPSPAATPQVIAVEAKIPVTLRPWYGGDLPLLGRLMGDPAMTVHIGGPENAKELRERHVRYSNFSPYEGEMFVILAGDGEEQKAAGSIGYWVIEWQGQRVWETGWSVLREFQGMGVASKAAALMIQQARANGRHRTMHAFPSVENAASNGVCRKAGFTLQGEVDFEYYRVAGRSMRCNDWCIDLFREMT